MEATKKPQNTQSSAAEKPLSGTEKTSSWEKAAELIAGDNQLMSSLLKLLLSPFTLIAGVGLIVYLFIQNKNHKEEIAKLREENKRLNDDKLLLAEMSEKFKKNYSRLKKVFEIEQSQVQARLLPQSNQLQNVNKSRTTHLR